MTASHEEGRELYNKLERVASRYLQVQLDYFGVVPWDSTMRQAGFLDANWQTSRLHIDVEAGTYHAATVLDQHAPAVLWRVGRGSGVGVQDAGGGGGRGTCP